MASKDFRPRSQWASISLVGEGHTGEPQANQERLTVAQAAAVLGITEGAVRSRIKRGTLPTTKERGKLFVLLCVCLSGSGHHRDLHSFPTRRSSDAAVDLDR